MKLNSRKNSSRSDSPRSANPSSSGPLPSFPSLSRHLRSKTKDTETLVTLNRSRHSIPTPGHPKDDVSMSVAGQRVIPATFNLVPIGGKNAVTDSDPYHDSAFDQAGGHQGTFKSDGAVLVKTVTDREADFYERALHGDWPARLLPKFYGRTDDRTAIKIENLTHGFRRPCVMDLKMGVQTVEDDESNILKRLKMTALDVVTRTKSAGVRLEGLSMYRALENTRVKGTKAQSHSISAHVRVSLQDVLTFFLTDESGVRTDVALRFQAAVEGILRQFEKNDKFRFIGSSILLIYDNDNRAPYMHWARALRKLHKINPNVRLSEDQVSGLTRRTRCDVRMIDFAHTGPLPNNMRRDEGYITGLRTILEGLKAIRKYRAKPIFSLQNAVVDVMEEQRQRALYRSASGGSQGPASGEKEFTFDTLLRELTPLAVAKSSDANESPSTVEETVLP